MPACAKNDIIHTSDILNEIRDVIKAFSKEKVLLLTDNRCEKYCFPMIEKAFDRPVFFLSLKPGERSKNISNVMKIWNFLSENNFSKHSLIINLGGGMVTDIGGFAASTFKRGMPFMNIPTSLLAQVDASIGGKNGINFKTIKNSIGTINEPFKVLISPKFLKTLNKRELRSGFAEMIKHALISDRESYDELIRFINRIRMDENRFQDLIRKSVAIKSYYIEMDLKESGLRKILNFGHTFGHAFESLTNDSKNQLNKLKHGEAVAFGMICSLYLSVKKAGFSETIFKELVKDLHSLYGCFHIPENIFYQILELIKKDKKNNKNRVLLVLLKAIGEPVYDISINEMELVDSLKFLNSLSEKRN